MVPVGGDQRVARPVDILPRRQRPAELRQGVVDPAAAVGDDAEIVANGRQGSRVGCRKSTDQVHGLAVRGFGPVELPDLVVQAAEAVEDRGEVGCRGVEQPCAVQGQPEHLVGTTILAPRQQGVPHRQQDRGGLRVWAARDSRQDRQGPGETGQRLVVLALGPEHDPEVVQAHRHVGMALAVEPGPQGQGATMVRQGGVEVAFVKGRVAQVVQAGGDVAVRAAVDLLQQGQGPTIRRPARSSRRDRRPGRRSC